MLTVVVVQAFGIFHSTGFVTESTLSQLDFSLIQRQNLALSTLYENIDGFGIFASPVRLYFGDAIPPIHWRT
jgi:hypothetical protein